MGRQGAGRGSHSVSAADLTSFLIMLREGLEASLIVGIVLAYLRQIGALRHAKFVWGGVVVAVAVSIAFLFGLQAVGAEFKGKTEEIFEGVTMLLAAGVLTWMIFWMMRQARLLKGELQRGVDRALTEGASWGLFLLAFFAVVREGVESALFLQAATFAAAGQSTLFGALVGLAGAVGLGVLVYAFGVRVDLRAFFRITAVVLILFAAGLVGHGVHELVEAGLLPALVEEVYEIRRFFSHQEGLGQLLRTLFGYSDSPTLLELLAYLAYLGAVVGLSRTRVIAAVAPRTQVAEKPTA